MKKEKLAIFDIDGTIFRKNLHFELLNELVYRGIFEKEVRKQLVEAYGQWLNHEGSYDDYREKLVTLYDHNIRGCHYDKIAEASQKVANFHAKRTYIFSSNLIEELRKDYFLLIISGSPLEIVKEYATIFDFDAYFGSVYEVDNQGIYTGECDVSAARNKDLVVKEFITKRGFSLEGSFGIGDTESDAKFLQLVSRPVAFNPNAVLREIAQKEGWKIVVEKKDVIYEF